MEAWRKEVQASIDMALQSDEDEEEYEEAFFSTMVAAVVEEVEGEALVIRKHGGSSMGRQNIFRDREAYHHLLYQDYFAENPTYGPVHFRRRFRMRQELYVSIMDAVATFDPWFVQGVDAVGRLGLSTLQKCTAALRMLAYGLPVDACDEYCRLGESTAHESMKRFVKAVRVCSESTYLRQPTRQDFERQMAINEARGFPGMFGSIDCMHWIWKNCLVAWQGQFQDKDKNRSIILEAIADQSLWIWHAFFGLPGGNNDIHVLDRSPLVSNLLRGEGRDLSFHVNGHVYPRFYLLADGIYLPWACFVQPIHEPIGEMKEHFTKCQEGARKDVERAFGVLQARFEILKNPVRQWDLGTIEDIMIACIILHNMIIEDERGLSLEPFADWGLPVERVRHLLSFRELQSGTRELENVEAHFALRNDLIEHLWRVKGGMQI